MKKIIVILLALAIASPALARSKKSQAKLDKRHAAAAAYYQSQANLGNARAGAVRQTTSERQYNQQVRARKDASRRAEYQRNTAKRRGSALIGF